MIECVYCGETRLAALRMEDEGRVVCYNCSPSYSKRHKRGRCVLCGKEAPIEYHHVFGRKRSDITLPLCVNCHRCISHGVDKANEIILMLMVGLVIRATCGEDEECMRTIKLKWKE